MTDRLPIEMRVRPTRNELRGLFVLILVASTAILAISYLGDPARGAADRYVQQAGVPFEEREAIAGDRDNITVTTGMDSPFKNTKALYAFAPDGRLLHYSNRTVYGDVDPTGDPRRVLVAGHDYFRGDQPECAGKCTQQNITYVNLTTGGHDRIYNYTTPGYRNSNWHDVDHLGGARYLIAGMVDDDAWIVNVSTGVRTWQWDAQASYPVAGGGPYPGDWVHLNDVNVIEAPPENVAETWFMISLRNQDQVVFVDPDDGVQDGWTLGCENCHDILFEQHNPDYIPPEHGGPAILVADSENNRVVEYERQNGSWARTWMWQDDRMSWPRDADRLPNGHTLITDSHGSRVIEVNKSGAIVWQTHVVNGYDSERLGSGDESTNGPSATRANLTAKTNGAVLSGQTSTELANEQEWDRVPELMRLWHAAQFVFPAWIGPVDVGVVIVSMLVVGLWLVSELWWRNYRPRWPLGKQPQEVTDGRDGTPRDD